jgi:hypothetical protein
MYFACNRSLKGFKLYVQSEGMLINFQSYKNIVSACEICYVYLCREAGSNIHKYTHACMHTYVRTYIHTYMHICKYNLNTQSKVILQINKSTYSR